MNQKRVDQKATPDGSCDETGSYLQHFPVTSKGFTQVRAT